MAMGRERKKKSPPLSFERPMARFVPQRPTKERERGVGIAGAHSWCACVEEGEEKVALYRSAPAAAALDGWTAAR
jgi:hypothetical protein